MKLYALCILLATAATAYAQEALPVNIDTYFRISRPLSSTGATLEDAYGAGLNLSGAFTRCPRFYTGITVSVSGYGSKSEDITFTTDEGEEIETKSTISHSFSTAGLFSRYYLFKPESRMNFFIDAKAEAVFFNTSLYIEDPDDATNCEPLENRALHKDKTVSAYAGAGIDVRLDGLFNGGSDWQCGPVHFTLTGGYNMGGRVSYMNVNLPDCGTHPVASPQVKSSPYYARFRNTQTQNVHSHQVGSIYTSQIRMFELNAGLSFKF